MAIIYVLVEKNNIKFPTANSILKTYLAFLGSCLLFGAGYYLKCNCSLGLTLVLGIKGRVN